MFKQLGYHREGGALIDQFQFRPGTFCITGLDRKIGFFQQRKFFVKFGIGSFFLKDCRRISASVRNNAVFTVRQRF